MIKPTQYETIVKEVAESVVADDCNQIFEKYFLNTEHRRSPLRLIQALFLMQFFVLVASESQISEGVYFRKDRQFNFGDPERKINYCYYLCAHRGKHTYTQKPASFKSMERNTSLQYVK